MKLVLAASLVALVAVTASAVPAPLHATSSQGGSDCTGPDCSADSDTWNDPWTNHPHLFISYVDSPGETDIVYPEEGDPTCSDCSPCSTVVTVSEQSSGCSYIYVGLGNRGVVPDTSGSNPPAPVSFTITSDCSNDADREVDINATCAGTSYTAAKAQLHCDDVVCE